MRATYLVRLILLELIIPIIFGAECKLWRSSLWHWQEHGVNFVASLGFQCQVLGTKQGTNKLHTLGVCVPTGPMLLLLMAEN
jgi:hypothetical protein